MMMPTSFSSSIFFSFLVPPLSLQGDIREDVSGGRGRGGELGCLQEVHISFVLIPDSKITPPRWNQKYGWFFVCFWYASVCLGLTRVIVFVLRCCNWLLLGLKPLVFFIFYFVFYRLSIFHFVFHCLNVYQYFLLYFIVYRYYSFLNLGGGTWRPREVEVREPSSWK